MKTVVFYYPGKVEKSRLEIPPLDSKGAESQWAAEQFKDLKARDSRLECWQIFDEKGKIQI